MCVCQYALQMLVVYSVCRQNSILPIPHRGIVTAGPVTTSSQVTGGWSPPFDIQSVDKYAGYFRMGS